MRKIAAERNKKDPTQLLIDERDEISVHTHLQKLKNGDVAERRERLAFDEIAVPGIKRNGMPEFPHKSEALRRMEKAETYPFISNDVNDFERFLVLEEFENTMKSVDPKRNWDFGDRVYEERFNKTTLSRSLYKSLLYDPNCIKSYYDREDALLVSCYYNKPATRVSRKKWTCNWRTLPNLENWIKCFKETDLNLKTTNFYNIDYNIVENLQERVKMMYPEDDSVIVCGRFNAGDESSHHYKVLKENFTFGIRKSASSAINGSELWITLENQTKLLVELEANSLKSSMQTESDDKKFFEGKLSPRIEAALLEKANVEDLNKKDVKEVQADKKEDKKTVKDITKEEKDAVLETKPQEVLQKTEPAEALAPESHSASFTVTLPNGLLVKYLPRGDIMQKIVKSSNNSPKKTDQSTNSNGATKALDETHRIITGKGSLIILVML